MRTLTTYGQSRLPFWQRVREFAVPPPMIHTATARREVGDWAGACAAARVEVHLNPRTVTRVHGRDVAARLRADLRHLAPDLLRWHMPRMAPDGLLRPGLTIALATYPVDGDRTVSLVVRTPPSWADAGQLMGIDLWDGETAHGHPHPHPDQRFRLDLHRHLWDARSASDLRHRAGTGDDSTIDHLDPHGVVPRGIGCAVDRWASEATMLLRAHGRDSGEVGVRLARGHRVTLRIREGSFSIEPHRRQRMPDLPDAATWVPPDVLLLDGGLIDPEQLHPLVAAALTGQPTRPHSASPTGPAERLVECRGAVHRIAIVDGVLVPLDHDPVELRREELLVALGGPGLACLRAIDEAHRGPECLADIRARLDHGDLAGAIGAVEALLGPDALVRSGALRDELEAAARRRVLHGLYRAGLTEYGPLPRVRNEERRRLRARLRHTR